jgi:hypothetical protein
MTPRTDKFKAQGREWLPLGLFEDLERENSRLRETLQNVRNLCTTDHESKEAFIARVLSILRTD